MSNKKIDENLPLPKKPKSYGDDYEFPEDFTMWTSIEVGQLMSKLAAYRGYIHRRLSIFELRLAKSKRKVKYESSKLMQELRDSDHGEREAVRLVAIDRGMRKHQKLADKYEDYVTMYTTVYYIYNEQIESLSREISRKRDE